MQPFLVVIRLMHDLSREKSCVRGKIAAATSFVEHALCNLVLRLRTVRSRVGSSRGSPSQELTYSL